MNAINEMYKKYGIKRVRECELTDACLWCTIPKKCKDCVLANTKIYPPFTAEKQLEILKIIGLLGNICITKREYNDMWCITTHHKNGMGQDLIFEEALSKWITNIYDSLSITIRNKVKEILER